MSGRNQFNTVYFQHCCLHDKYLNLLHSHASCPAFSHHSSYPLPFPAKPRLSFPTHPPKEQDKPRQQHSWRLLEEVLGWIRGTKMGISFLKGVKRDENVGWTQIKCLDSSVGFVQNWYHTKGVWWTIGFILDLSRGKKKTTTTQRGTKIEEIIKILQI